MWTEENQRLLCRGFLKIKYEDGSDGLISWKPMASVCRVVELAKDMSKMTIDGSRKTIAASHGFEADVAEAIREWCATHGGDAEKLIAKCGFKRSSKTTR